MTRPRVYADCHNLDDHNRVRLTCAGTIQDLARHGLELSDGLNLSLYMDDVDDLGHPDALQVEGTVRYNDQERCWVAVVDWAAVRHASDESSANGNGTGDNVSTPAETTLPTRRG